VNAAYLLLTSAWLAGADPAPQAHAAPAAAAPVVSTGSCCGGGCSADTCCDPCGRSGFFDRVRDKFRRKNDCCDTCAPACQAPCQTSCAPTCCDSGPRFDFSRFKRKNNDCCAPVTSCCQPVVSQSCGCNNACQDDCRQGFFSRLRDKFRRKNDCCDTGCGGVYNGGCNSCGNGGYGGYGGPAYPGQGPVHQGAPAGQQAEPIKPPEAPKTMPKAGGAAFNGTIDLNSTRLGVEQENKQPY
jgi:hypothetical protein